MPSRKPAIQFARMLRLPAVEDRVGRKRSSIYRDVAEGRFPPPVKLGPRAIGWPEHVIDTWIDERVRQEDRHHK